MKTAILAVWACAAVLIVLAVTPARAARPAGPGSPFASTFVVVTGRVVDLCRVTHTDQAGLISEIRCRPADFKPIRP